MTHYEATPENEKHFNIDRKVQNYFTGKGQQPLSDVWKAHELTEADAQNITPWLLEEYAFKTKASASRALKTHRENAKFEESLGFWKVSCKLVEVNI
jgi:hypothetical protein